MTRHVLARAAVLVVAVCVGLEVFAAWMGGA